MKRLWAPALLAAAGLAGGAAVAAAESTVLFPLQRGVRDVEAAAEVEQVLYEELQAFGEVADRERTRAALRRLRLRAPDTAGAEALRRLGSELEATWLLAVTLHDAPTGRAPDLALSARLYEAATGEMIWAGFEAASGLDSRKLLGLGTLDRVDRLAPIPIRRLLIASPLAGGPDPRKPAAATRLRLALVPLTAYLNADALTAAAAATEATRAALIHGGARVAPPECVDAALRSQELRTWGELPAAARIAVREACAADLLVTGSLERWEIGGTAQEPRPVVALALRLLDGVSGRILWMGSREATGWDRQGLFGLGRIHSRGALLDRLLSSLSRGLLGAGTEVASPAMTVAQLEPKGARPELDPEQAPPAAGPGPTAAAEAPARSRPVPEADRPAISPEAAVAPAAPQPEVADGSREVPRTALAEEPATAAGLVEGARTSLGRGLRYDATYVEMAYPGGDPPADRGTAVDLVVRAFRRIGVDLQRAVHEDILRDQSAYGYVDRDPDTNVSHRRIRNLVVFFERHGQPVGPDDYRSGDVVFWDTNDDGRGDHAGIVSSSGTAEGRPLVIHHLRPDGESAGRPSEDDVLFRWSIVNHFRWPGPPTEAEAADTPAIHGTEAPAVQPEPPASSPEAERIPPQPETAAVIEESDTPEPAAADEPKTAAGLVEGARAWLGRGLRYDASYVEMAYPGGDPAADRGTAVDLVVRAFRRIGVDLQQAVHEEIVGDPAAYGYADREPDTNLSHRRIRNLLIFFERNGETVIDDDWRAGDVLFWDTNGNGRGDHVGIVSSARTAEGRPLVIHHRRPDAEFTGAPSEEDVLGRWPVAAHFRTEVRGTHRR